MYVCIRCDARLRKSKHEVHVSHMACDATTPCIPASIIPLEMANRWRHIFVSFLFLRERFYRGSRCDRKIEPSSPHSEDNRQSTKDNRQLARQTPSNTRPQGLSTEMLVQQWPKTTMSKKQGSILINRKQTETRSHQINLNPLSVGNRCRSCPCKVRIPPAKFTTTLTMKLGNEQHGWTNVHKIICIGQPDA